MNKNFLLYCLCAVLMLTLAFYSSGQKISGEWGIIGGNNRTTSTRIGYGKLPSDTTYYVVIKMKTSEYLAAFDTLGAILSWAGKSTSADTRDNLISTAQRQIYRINSTMRIDTVIKK